MFVHSTFGYTKITSFCPGKLNAIMNINILTCVMSVFCGIPTAVK